MSSEKFKAEYGISRKIRYHGKRLRFFDTLHRLVSFTNAVLGSSAFVTVISGMPALAAWLTGIVAIVSALDSVVGFSERARAYSEQRARYYDLYCEIVAAKESTFDPDYFREKRLRIDRDSPPIRRVLDVLCRNEEDIARGFSHDETIRVGRIRALLAHVIDLPPTRWLTIAEAKQVSSA